MITVELMQIITWQGKLGYILKKDDKKKLAVILCLDGEHTVSYDELKEEK